MKLSERAFFNEKYTLLQVKIDVFISKFDIVFNYLYLYLRRELNKNVGGDFFRNK